MRRSSLAGAPAETRGDNRRRASTVQPAFHNMKLTDIQVGIVDSEESDGSERGGYKRNLPGRGGGRGSTGPAAGAGGKVQRRLSIVRGVPGDMYKKASMGGAGRLASPNYRDAGARRPPSDDDGYDEAPRKAGPKRSSFGHKGPRDTFTRSTYIPKQQTQQRNPIAAADSYEDDDDDDGDFTHEFVGSNTLSSQAYGNAAASRATKPVNPRGDTGYHPSHRPKVSAERRKVHDHDEDESQIGYVDKHERTPWEQPAAVGDDLPDPYEIAGEWDYEVHNDEVQVPGNRNSQSNDNPTNPNNNNANAAANQLVNSQVSALEKTLSKNLVKGSEDEDEEEEEEDDKDDFKFVRKTLPRNAISHEEERMEFRCLDYSPLINVRPVDLVEQLRPTKAGRKIRMFIAITCYNEDGDELRRTLQGIASNLPKLAKAGLHWSEIAVCILIDGRENASRSMIDFLQFEMKLYDPTILRNNHRGRPVVMHVFERSVELPKHSSNREYHYPLQCMLALKERNGGKLNSHLWYFSGFCVQINPKYTLLLDVGTVPHSAAIVRMYMAMEEDPQIGGSCGEIAVRNARPWHFMDAAQAFEYKVSHYLDKAAESVCGYITVLPGAFSMYRWVSIRGEPLCAYFTIEEIPITELGPAVSNMYLAEDRILCFEILAKRHRQWLLRYVPGCVADTDAPQTLLELIKQRRRWLNGSFFALVYYLYHFPRFMRTNHGIFRKFLLFLQFLYLLTNSILSWFSISTLFLSFLLVFNQAIDYAPFGGREIKTFFIFAYALLILLQIITGLAGKVNQMQTVYFTTMLVYNICMVFSVFFGAWLVFNANISLWVGLSFACSICSYLVAAFMHGSLFKVAVMFIQYLMMIPVFVNMFPIYSFCNMHDISWGTKEGNLQSETRRMHQGKADRALQKAHKAEEAIMRLKQQAIDARKRALAAAQQAAQNAAVRAQVLSMTNAQANQTGAKNPAGSSAASVAIGVTADGDDNKSLVRRNSNMSNVTSASNANKAKASIMGGLSGARQAMVPTLAGVPEEQQGGGINGGAAGQTPLDPNKGAERIKMIDEDNLVEGYLDANMLGKKDMLLNMNLNQAMAVADAMLDFSEVDTKKLIRDAKKAAKAHAEAAEREKRLADELALNKAAMQAEFNMFRMRMLASWLFSNVLFVVLMTMYDPNLAGYASFVAGAVVYTVGFKLVGSFVYQLLRFTRFAFRKMCGFCFRIDEGEGDVRRVVCCMRPLTYYALDDMWEAEHPYAHSYPEGEEMEKADAEMGANVLGMGFAGNAPDGTPLYYADDGQGPYDINGIPLNPVEVGFLVGDQGELLAPDGSPVIDENGEPILYSSAPGAKKFRSHESEEASVHTYMEGENVEGADTGVDQEERRRIREALGKLDRANQQRQRPGADFNAMVAAAQLAARQQQNDRQQEEEADEDDVSIEMENEYQNRQQHTRQQRSSYNMNTMPGRKKSEGVIGVMQSPPKGMHGTHSDKSLKSVGSNKYNNHAEDTDDDGSEFDDYYPPPQPQSRRPPLAPGLRLTTHGGHNNEASGRTSSTGRTGRDEIIVRVNSTHRSKGNSTHRSKDGSTQRSDHSNSFKIDMAGASGRNEFGYHDPVSNKWVPPQARESSEDSDVDSLDDAPYRRTTADAYEPKLTARSPSTGMLLKVTSARKISTSAQKNTHRADTTAVATVTTTTTTTATSAGAVNPPAEMVDLGDLLADAEQQSDRVLARKNLTTKDI